MSEEEVIRTFVDVTNVPSETARMWLEKSNWDLEQGLDNFYQQSSTELPEEDETGGLPEEDETGGSSRDEGPEKWVKVDKRKPKYKCFIDLESVTFVPGEMKNLKESIHSAMKTHNPYLVNDLPIVCFATNQNEEKKEAIKVLQSLPTYFHVQWYNTREPFHKECNEERREILKLPRPPKTPLLELQFSREIGVYAAQYPRNDILIISNDPIFRSYYSSVNKKKNSNSKHMGGHVYFAAETEEVGVDGGEIWNWATMRKGGQANKSKATNEKGRSSKGKSKVTTSS